MLLLLFTLTSKGLEQCSQVHALPDICLELFKEGPTSPFKEKECYTWLKNNQATLKKIETECNLGELIFVDFKFFIENIYSIRIRIKLLQI